MREIRSVLSLLKRLGEGLLGWGGERSGFIGRTEGISF